MSRLLKAALDKAKNRGRRTARGVIQSLIIQTSAARQWSAQEVAYLLLRYELVDCTWGTVSLRTDRKRPMRKIADEVEGRDAQKAAGAPYLEMYGRRGEALGAPANWEALSPFEFIRAFNLRFAAGGKLVCEARAEEPVVVIKPLLFPHASDRGKMSRFCKGRLLAYLPDEPGCVDACEAGDVERYYALAPHLATKFPWLRDDVPKLERFLKAAGGDCGSESSQESETASGRDAPEDAGDRWAAWFRAQQEALGDAAEDGCLELFGDDFDWVAESASKYSCEDLRRAAAFVKEQVEGAAGQARTRTFAGAVPFAALTERQKDFVRWGLFCLEDAVGQRSLPPQFLDVEGTGGSGKSAAIQTLQSSAELLLEAAGARNPTQGVKALAPTGCAAVNIEGETIHSAARIFCKDLGTSPLTRERAQDSFRDVKLAVLEEKSMIGEELLGQYAANVSWAKPEKRGREPLAGIHHVLVGDRGQLPPVKDVPCWVGPEEGKNAAGRATYDLFRTSLDLNDLDADGVPRTLRQAGGGQAQAAFRRLLWEVREGRKASPGNWEMQKRRMLQMLPQSETDSFAKDPYVVHFAPHAGGSREFEHGEPCGPFCPSGPAGGSSSGYAQ